jgi:hypothetical protein
LIELSVPIKKVRLITTSKTLYKLAQYVKIQQPMSLEIFDLEDSFDWALENEVKSLTIKKSILTKEFSKKAHENGIELITFAAKSSKGNKQMIELNPDFIQTDNLSSINKLLE